MLADKKHSSNERAIRLRQEYLAAHPEDDGDQKFYCDGTIEKKLRIIGRERNTENKHFLRRVYLSVPTANMPEISEELFKIMERDDLLSETEIAMNMEVYGEEGASEINSIVIYIFGNKPELMTKAFKAIKEAKTNTVELWNKSDADRYSSLKKTLGDLMIPVDDDVAFVEMADGPGYSYHSGISNRIRRELDPMSFSGVADFNRIKKGLDQFAPSTPGPMSPDTDDTAYYDISARNKYMPALVFDDQKVEA